MDTSAVYNPASWKTCGSCKSVLPASMFGKDARQSDGLARACRECRRLCHKRNRAVARLNSRVSHQRRRADEWKSRHEALLAALAEAPPALLASLPEDVRPKPHSLRRARWIAAKASAEDVADVPGVETAP